MVRVFDQVADRVGRDRRHGAIIWRLKTPAAVPCPPRQIEIIGDGDMVNPAHIADHWLEL